MVRDGFPPKRRPQGLSARVENTSGILRVLRGEGLRRVGIGNDVPRDTSSILAGVANKAGIAVVAGKTFGPRGVVHAPVVLLVADVQRALVAVGTRPYRPATANTIVAYFALGTPLSVIA